MSFAREKLIKTHTAHSITKTKALVLFLDKLKRCLFLYKLNISIYGQLEHRLFVKRDFSQ